MRLLILSVADVHSPRYLQLFVASLNSLIDKHFNLVILAGDLVENGVSEMLKPVVDALKSYMSKKGITAPVVSVFGNEEYIGREDLYKNVARDFIWLDDEYRVFRIDGNDVCIVGSRGVLRKPTPWQRKNIPNIVQIYEKRLNNIKAMLMECSRHGHSILVTHYASSYATLYGEPHNIYDYLGYPIIESLSPNAKPRIAIHGHAHNSRRLYSYVNGVHVYNVSLAARKSMSVIDVEL